MIIDLDKKINEISNKQYWYFGNHGKDFTQMCYLTDLISQLSSGSTQSDLDKIRNKFNEENNLELKASMFKSIISAKMYGLLDVASSRQYVKCNPTEVFYEIRKRTSGKYEKVELYQDIIEQQIEKIYYITDLFDTDGKEGFGLYPLFLLYKVLIEVGNIYGTYEINRFEIEYLLTTAKTYDEWKDIVDTIVYYRTQQIDIETTVERLLNRYNTNAPDQRYHLIIKHLNYLDIDGKKSYKIKPEFISVIGDKVKVFEIINKIPPKSMGALPNGLEDFNDYISFLGQNIPLLPKL